MHTKPWDLNPDLSEGRLIALASFIANVRSEVIELHDESLGDTRLSLGMRAYECCRSRISEVAGSSDFSWLSILEPEGRFTFAMGVTPVRFTRNNPKQLPGRKLVVSLSAMKQMSLLDPEPHAEVRWFFVFDSVADAAYFVGYSEFGEIVCQWEIPVELGVVVLTDITSSLPDAVELEEPTIDVKKPNSLKIASHDD